MAQRSIDRQTELSIQRLLYACFASCWLTRFPLRRQHLLASVDLAWVYMMVVERVSLDLPL